MPKMILNCPAGEVHELFVPDGVSVMRGATQGGIDRIVGDCGGNMTCATCHILVDPAFLPLLAPMSDGEDTILDFTAAPRQPNSRLSCQVIISDGWMACADPQL